MQSGCTKLATYFDVDRREILEIWQSPIGARFYVLVSTRSTCVGVFEAQGVMEGVEVTRVQGVPIGP